MDNLIRSEFPDLPPFIETLRTLDGHSDSRVRNFFDWARPVTITRAPGRLDVMGGIADYSGSLVLQRPVAEATFVAVQQSEQATIEIASLSKDPEQPVRTSSIELPLLAPGGVPRDYAAIRAFLAEDQQQHWASYVVGPFVVLIRERDVRFPKGAKVLISSAVPEGKGVASSAALEVAVMQAVSASFNLALEPYAMALLCQKAENFVAGAPCGAMDQMTSVFGQADSLLALLCQPAEIQSPVAVPQEITFWGVDSGERHAVGGASYDSVRTGAFMGHRIICRERDLRYLANVDPEEFEKRFASLLPEEILGGEFLARYGETADTVTRVQPSQVYKVRQPTAHPVYEHRRVSQFRDLLQAAASEEEWTSMGELMYQSHASYSDCGLGSPGTNGIVELVRQEGPRRGLYGARITGGGSGGTVVVLGRADADHVVRGIAARYERATGYRPAIFSGASSGAASFGSMSLRLPE